VVGLLLLFVGLIVRGRNGTPVDPSLRSTAQGLLSNLSLLFVPAGVGVVTQLGVLGANLLPIAVSLLVSTVLGLLVTGWVMQRLSAADE
jgi:holin-like protein